MVDHKSTLLNSMRCSGPGLDLDQTGPVFVLLTHSIDVFVIGQSLQRFFWADCQTCSSPLQYLCLVYPTGPQAAKFKTCFKQIFHVQCTSEIP